MKPIMIVMPGKPKANSPLLPLLNEYVKRISPFAQLKHVFTPEIKLPDNPSQSEISRALEREGAELIKAVPAKFFTFAMCVEGGSSSSAAFAEDIRQAQADFNGTAFLIGSSHGLSNGVRQAANRNLSLSGMTFTHDIALLVLTEQIYRAFTIINNMKYNK